MLEITEQFPDVVKNILDAYLPSNRGETTLSSFIIDSEIVGVEGGNFLPFQDLSTRRKKNGSLVEGDVKVKVFVFDLMYLNGTSCVDAPLYKRKQMLHQSFKPTEKFDFVQSKILTTYDEEVINSFFKGAVEKGTEGLMLKQLGCENGKDDSMVSTETESSYEAGTRSRNWLKMKRDYVEGYADTIDVVPIGAWYGNGRKAQKSFLSPVLLAVYDDEEDIFRSVSRCMSFTDKMYESMKRFYFYGTPYPEDADGRNVEKGSSVDDNVDSKEQDVDDGKHDQGAGKREWLQDDEDESEEAGEYVNCFPSRPSSFHISTNEKATIWFKPLEVFEVSFADLTLSRVHTAAAGLVDDEGRGVALRFPRFRRRRPDKKPEQATTSSQIAQMFARQTKTKPGNDG
jgi:DNA ligase-1